MNQISRWVQSKNQHLFEYYHLIFFTVMTNYAYGELSTGLKTPKAFTPSNSLSTRKCAA